MFLQTHLKARTKILFHQGYKRWVRLLNDDLKVRSILTALFHQFPFHRKLKFAFSICPLRVAIALTHQLCHSLSDLPDLRLAQHRQAIVDRSLITLR